MAVARKSLADRLKEPRTWIGAVLAVVLALVVWWVDQDGGAEPDATPSSSATAGRNATEAVLDPASGLRWVAESALPAEARQVLVAIEDGGPFVRQKDGSTFGNYEGVLPRKGRGHYREYTVPTPGVSHAGARRIVTGDAGEYYWTADHYQTFERIRR